MQFNDLTLASGKIGTRRHYDTDALVPEAIDLAGRMLAQLRRGKLAVSHEIPGMPPFYVSLGVADWLGGDNKTDVRHPGRVFCVSERPGAFPFQINLVLVGDVVDDDWYAVATMIALSHATLGEETNETEEQLESLAGVLFALRPVCATVPAMLPTDMSIMSFAPDFGTCFTAAMLLEA